MSYTHEKFELKNNISGIAVKVPCAKTTTLIIACKVGSINEKDHEHGIAHLLEHMLFRGSSLVKNIDDLTQKMDQLGATFNAYVSKHITYYHCEFYWDENNFQNLLNLMISIVSQPLLNAKDLEIEREVVLNEISEYLTDEEEHLDELITKIMFEKHPLAHVITGNTQVIKKCTINSLRNFYNTYYINKNIYGILVGKYSKQGLNIFKSLLATINEKENKSYVDPLKLSDIDVKDSDDYIRFKKNVKVETRKDNDLTFLGIGFPSIGFKNSSVEEMIFLNDLIGGSPSSRLYKSLREKKGLVYDVSSDYFSYPDNGLIIIKTSFHPSKLKEVLRIMYDEIENVKKEISTETFRQHLASLIRETLLDAETIFNIAEYYAQELIFNGDNINPYHHQITKYKKIRNKDVIELSRQILNWDKATIVAIGSLDHKHLINALPKELL
jgi:predicted Zn-dependent peptidase